MKDCEGWLFGYHDWTKWQDIRTGDLHRPCESESCGTFVLQERRCTLCDKVQRRSERTIF